MTITPITRYASAALVGTALTLTAKAATTVYSAGDLFIGFHQAGTNSDYLVDIGQASNFTGMDPNTSTTLVLGNIAADLTGVFGSNWATDPTVQWGIVGTTHLSTVGSDGPGTVYASRQGNAWTTTPWNDAFVLSTADSKISSMASSYRNKTSSTNSPVGLIQTNITTSSNNAYGSYQPGGVNAGAGNLSFGYFNPTIEASGANGITDSNNASLALFRLIQGDSNPAQPEGTFYISNGGTVSYTSVPEPASTALGLIGITLMIVRRRRI